MYVSEGVVSREWTAGEMLGMQLGIGLIATMVAVARCYVRMDQSSLPLATRLAWNDQKVGR